jgi:nucleoid-associated protein YgaU
VPVCAASGEDDSGEEFANPADKEVYEGPYLKALPSGHIIFGLTDTPNGRFRVVNGKKQKKDSEPQEQPLLHTHIIGNPIGRNDSLSSISGKWYHDVLLWPILFDYNKSATFTDPNRITPGQEIKVPKIKLSDSERREIRNRGLNWR